MLTAYRKDYNDWGDTIYRKLKPTGRWKIETGPYYAGKMFVEHKGLVFKRWISETFIEFLPEESSTIFECQ